MHTAAIATLAMGRVDGVAVVSAGGAEDPFAGRKPLVLRAAAARGQPHEEQQEQQEQEQQEEQAAVVATARHRMALMWAFLLPALVGGFIYGAILILPRPPPGQRFTRPPKGSSGIPFSDYALAAARAVALAAVVRFIQERVARPWLERRPPSSFSSSSPSSPTSSPSSPSSLSSPSSPSSPSSVASFSSSPSDPPPPPPPPKIYWATSVLSHSALVARLAWHRLGPDAHAAASDGDLGFRMAMVTVWFAQYFVDLLQLRLRPHDLPKGVRALVVPHHILSLAWFSAWMLLLAPRGAEGAPIWETTLIYLAACIPNHAFKLLTCFSRPKWAGFALVGAVACHWVTLLASQAYYNSTCGCTPAGCWTPASVVMIAGGYGMVLFDFKAIVGSVVAGQSASQGARVRLSEIIPLVMDLARNYMD